MALYIPQHAPGPRRQRLYEVIFGIDTRAGRLFDILLLWSILLSVFAVMLESVPSIRADYPVALRIVEWVFTILFTIEYILRISVVRRPMRYALSFYGLVDLLAILPTYLSLFIPGAQSLLVIRALRLLRVFRVLKLIHFVQDADLVLTALRNSRRKITAFLGTVVIITLIAGTLMYLIEGGVNEGFSSIPQGMYWAIVTITTVGYGDISPVTNIGRLLAGALMITGYSIIAVPTGIVSVELAQATRAGLKRACAKCGRTDHDLDARFCKHCGGEVGGTT